MAKANRAATSKSTRVFFTKDDALELPNLVNHQKESWKDFVESGLSEIFA